MSSADRSHVRNNKHIEQARQNKTNRKEIDKMLIDETIGNREISNDIIDIMKNLSAKDAAILQQVFNALEHQSESNDVISGHAIDVFGTAYHSI